MMSAERQKLKKVPLTRKKMQSFSRLFNITALAKKFYSEKWLKSCMFIVPGELFGDVGFAPGWQSHHHYHLPNTS
jgi:hypothetical protein